MRGTVAKRLRRQAEKDTPGLPDREDRAIVQEQRGRRTFMVVNGPATTRAVYRMFKRQRKGLPTVTIKQ